jgi:hypothetical protein
MEYSGNTGLSERLLFPKLKNTIVCIIAEIKNKKLATNKYLCVDGQPKFQRRKPACLLRSPVVNMFSQLIAAKTINIADTIYSPQSEGRKNKLKTIPNITKRNKAVPNIFLQAASKPRFELLIV